MPVRNDSFVRQTERQVTGKTESIVMVLASCPTTTKDRDSRGSRTSCGQVLRFLWKRKRPEQEPYAKRT